MRSSLHLVVADQLDILAEFWSSYPDPAVPLVPRCIRIRLLEPILVICVIFIRVPARFCPVPDVGLDELVVPELGIRGP